jgi:hypothetical protein
MLPRTRTHTYTPLSPVVLTACVSGCVACSQVLDEDAGFGLAVHTLVLNTPPTAALAQSVSPSGSYVLDVSGCTDAEDAWESLAFEWRVALSEGAVPPTDPDSYEAVGQGLSPSLRAAGAPGQYTVSGFRLSGKHWFQVTVVDSHGGVATAYTSISASLAISAGPDVAIPEGQWWTLNATLRGSGLAPSSVLGMEWQVNNSGVLWHTAAQAVVDLVGADGLVAWSLLNVTHMPAFAGAWSALTWTVFLDGQNASTTVLARGNAAPVATLSAGASVSLTLPNSEASLTVASQDDGNDTVSAQWDVVCLSGDVPPWSTLFQDDLARAVRGGVWATPFVFSAPQPGSYSVAVAVQDGGGLVSDAATTTVVVSWPSLDLALYVQTDGAISAPYQSVRTFVVMSVPGGDEDTQLALTPFAWAFNTTTWQAQDSQGSPIPLTCGDSAVCWIDAAHVVEPGSYSIVATVALEVRLLLHLLPAPPTPHPISHASAVGARARARAYPSYVGPCCRLLVCSGPFRSPVRHHGV